ncbi:MAG TPA: LLM class flavin-dependent oxidoreductase [Candidatus Xenobia bacterium]|jgi:alkanesulfonate monooxygenase SsuD/methylene tetrahydromethanopterin reductase-like flavin-dependent oxidoreductase (luciferase family)
MPRLLFGTHIVNTAPWPVARAMARAADVQRWHSVWTYDHMYSPLGAWLPVLAQARGESEETPCLNGWALLSALAPLTQRVRIGCLVSAITFHQPTVLAKMAATVDVISGGRLTLGLGAANYEPEHEAYGLPFPSLKERHDRLEEAAQIIRKLFKSTGRVSHSDGTFYRLHNAPFVPVGARPGGPPILIAGSGEKRTLRTAARYGDAINVGGSPAEVRHKIEVLEKHCEAAQRNPAEIHKTVGIMAYLTRSEEERQKILGVLHSYLPAAFVQTMPIGSAQQIVDNVSGYVGLVDEVIFLVQQAGLEVMEQFDQGVLAAFD